VSLTDLVSDWTKLYPSGRYLKGICPLHEGDDGPTLIVNEETQQWHCFGECATGGGYGDFERLAYGE